MTRAASHHASPGAAPWIFLLLGVLLLLRLPSLVQPAGADQALYAYVGTRILDGGLPYRDAWDQKPPAVHFLYGALYGMWRHESVVPVADLLTAGLVAFMLLRLGRLLSASPVCGPTAASLFLFLGDPTFNRLSGVRIRAQCETFIALAITAALLLSVVYARAQRAGTSGQELLPGTWRRRDSSRLLAVGALLGLAVAFKYNAVVYAIPILAVLAPGPGGHRAAAHRVTLVGIGALLPIALMLGVFAAGGALTDLYHATVRYNLEYSGETYEGFGSFLGYLLTFPVRHARVDALWMAGGLGCVILLLVWLTDRRRDALLAPVFWVAAACLSIAINGSRGLPQYFVQAAPALALAAGLAAAVVWPATRLRPRLRPAARLGGVVLVAFGAARVTDFDKLPRNAAHDLAFMAGRISRETHLARYGGHPDAKYAALSISRLGAYLKTHTTPAEPVYVFGFSAGAYLAAERVSPSRFFWSRPVLVGFNEGIPGYGADGVLEELERRPPRYVVLQIHDWAPPPGDSASFFTGHPRLGTWLRSGYRRVEYLEDYEIWLRERPAADEPGRIPAAIQR